MPSPMKTASTEQIIATLRHAAMCERNHKGITYDHGTTLVDLVAYHGDRLADALEQLTDPPATRMQFPDGSVPGNANEAILGWKQLYEAERADHEATIKHDDKMLNELSE